MKGIATMLAALAAGVLLGGCEIPQPECDNDSVKTTVVELYPENARQVSAALGIANELDSVLGTYWSQEFQLVAVQTVERSDEGVSTCRAEVHGRVPVAAHKLGKEVEKLAEVRYQTYLTDDGQVYVQILN